jgi:hypothetical protein
MPFGTRFIARPLCALATQKNETPKFLNLIKKKMEQLKLSRIKAAGKNISNIGYLILVSNVVPVIAFLHISNLDTTDFANVDKYYMIYGIVYLILSISIMANVFFAGNNLSLCDIEKEDEAGKVEKQIVYRETTENKTLKIISINNETIGAEVFIDEKIAPDGEYLYLNDNRKLIVKNGRIEKMQTI